MVTLLLFTFTILAIHSKANTIQQTCDNLKMLLNIIQEKIPIKSETWDTDSTHVCICILYLGDNRSKILKHIIKKSKTHYLIKIKL